MCVLHVELDPLGVRDVVPARDLPEPGDAGPERRDERKRIAVARDLVGHDGTPAHDAHVAGQDVPELGELVETDPPQRPSDRRDPRIAAQLEALFELRRELRRRARG